MRALTHHPLRRRDGGTDALLRTDLLDQCSFRRLQPPHGAHVLPLKLQGPSLIRGESGPATGSLALRRRSGRALLGGGHEQRGDATKGPGEPIERRSDRLDLPGKYGSTTRHWFFPTKQLSSLRGLLWDPGALYHGAQAGTRPFDLEVDRNCPQLPTFCPAVDASLLHRRQRADTRAVPGIGTHCRML